MEDFTNKWRLVNKGKNGKYCHLKKCQNMEVVNYFTNLPFPIFTKNIFPYFTNCEKLHKLARPTNCEEYHKHIIFTIVNYFTKLGCHLLPKEYMVDVGIVGKFYQ